MEVITCAHTTTLARLTATGRNTHTHTHTHKVLPLPTAIHHSHSFRMWTVQREACDLIYEFVLSRKGRLFGIFLDNA